MLTFLERLSHHALPKNRKRETLDACIKVSFKVNKGNKFGDFGYCPLNRGCSVFSAIVFFPRFAVP